MADLNQMTDLDLTARARAALEAAYERRPREKASREDFTAGFIAALAWLGSHSSFRPRHDTATGEDAR